MKTLLLTSTGARFDSSEIQKILPKPPGELKLGHVMTASKPEPNKTYVTEHIKQLKVLGLSVEDIDIEGKTLEELREFFKDKDIIYVQGGNTFYLLKAVKESGFDKLVPELLDEGKIYIGISAGSMICGPTIETAGWKNVDANVVGLKDLTALGLVPFIIFVHYRPEHRETILESAPRSKYPLKILTDDQAILVQDGKYQLVGKGPEITL